MNIFTLKSISLFCKPHYKDYSSFMIEASEKQKLELMKYAAQKATEEQRRVIKEVGKLDSLHRLSD